jgi:hypothetical protein
MAEKIPGKHEPCFRKRSEVQHFKYLYENYIFAPPACYWTNLLFDGLVIPGEFGQIWLKGLQENH